MQPVMAKRGAERVNAPAPGGRRHTLRELRERNVALASQIEERERELGATQTLTSSIFENSPDLIKVLDLSGRILLTNNESDRPPCEHVYVAQGRSWIDCWPRETSELIEKAVADAGVGLQSRFTAARKIDGAKTQWFDVVVTPMDNPAGERRILAVSRDVTAHHELEEELLDAKERAEAAALAQAEFVATMSHELRTPLAAIISHLDLFDRSAPRVADDRRRLERIREAAEDLLRIINDVLDSARIEADGIELAAHEFDLRVLCEGIVSLMAPLAQRKGLRLVFEIDRTRPADLVGDSGRLRQVLLNLLGNAIKFTDAGEVKLCVEMGARADGRLPLVITVSDTGIGMSERSRAAMFERFQQLDPSIKRRYGGTGLGLAISRHLVEHMGGRIEVESEPGQGSVFTLRLDCATPRTSGDFSATAQSPSPQIVNENGSFEARVLVVDDNAFHREIGADLLSAIGCQVEVVADGEAAIEAVSLGNFDLVLLDEQMPGLSGSETAQRLRRLPKRPKIVACTANLFATSSDDALFDDRLIKPLTRAVVAPLLSRFARQTRDRGQWLPPEQLAKYMDAFRDDLDELARRLDHAPGEIAAAKVHELISTAAIFEFEVLSVALRTFELSLVGAADPQAASKLRKALGVAHAAMNPSSPAPSSILVA